MIVTISDVERKMKYGNRKSSATLFTFYFCITKILTIVRSQNLTEHDEMSAANCKLECPEGVACIIGQVNDHPSILFNDGSSTLTSMNGYWTGAHCKCPPGTTGLMCEIKYTSCSDSDHTCYNGGTCVPGQMDYFGNDQLFCDCTNAIDNVAQIQYVGKYCEHAVVLSTTDTTADEGNPTNSTEEAKTSEICQNNETSYCLNGGKCNLNYPNSGSPCECEKGFSGDRCEFADGTVPNCTLPCTNGGSCVLGNRTTINVKGFWDGVIVDSDNDGMNDLDYMHCDCPDTHDGPLCSIERTPCGTSASTGQQSYCYFGSECNSIVDPKNSSNLIQTCDCKAANSADAVYVGQFCQYEADLECKTDTNEQYFCANGGDCSMDLASKVCQCLDGFNGRSCEYLDSEILPPGVGSLPTGEGDGIESVEDVNNDCNIQCVHGTCHVGYKNVSQELNGIVQHTQHLYFDSKVTEYAHCVCDNETQWTGLLCDTPIDSCGNDGKHHVCLHGGKCVLDGDEQLCDCEGATGTSYEESNSLASFYAGQHCEHPVHDICTTDPNPIQGLPLSFCVNGGVCKSKVSPGQIHPGCICEQGFVGPHCEIRESATVSGSDLSTRTSTSWTAEDARQRNRDYNTEHPNKLSSNKIAIIVVSCFIIFGVLVYVSITYVRRHRRRERQKQSNTITWADKYRDHPTDDVDDQHNIAPRRSSIIEPASVSISSNSTNRLSARSVVFETIKRANGALSSRDPMATHLAPSSLLSSKKPMNTRVPTTSGVSSSQQSHTPIVSDDSEEDDDLVVVDGDNNIADSHGKLKMSNSIEDQYAKEFNKSPQNENDAIIKSSASRQIEQQQPQIYIGPPRDEDGHVLHNVEIV